MRPFPEDLFGEWLGTEVASAFRSVEFGVDIGRAKFWSLRQWLGQFVGVWWELENETDS
jgi:hypothetical protein